MRAILRGDDFNSGTYQHGTVILDQAVNLPEGAHLRVTLDSADAPLRDDEDRLSDGRPWPKTPEEIEAFIAEMDATPGIEVSDEEYAQMEADRLARKAQGIIDNEERMKHIMRMFE